MPCDRQTAGWRSIIAAKRFIAARFEDPASGAPPEPIASPSGRSGDRTAAQWALFRAGRETHACDAAIRFRQSVINTNVRNIAAISTLGRFGPLACPRKASSPRESDLRRLQFHAPLGMRARPVV